MLTKKPFVGTAKPAEFKNTFGPAAQGIKSQVQGMANNARSQVASAIGQAKSAAGQATATAKRPALTGQALAATKRPAGVGMGKLGAPGQLKKAVGGAVKSAKAFAPGYKRKGVM